MLAGELAEGVPEGHPRHFFFLGTEADALFALGLSGEAAARWQRVAAALEKRSLAEPDRADYLRDLSVSYNKMGDLMGSLGAGDEARQFYQKALEIAERLVRQEPDRADYQADLVASLGRVGTRESLERALAILRRLEGQGKLTAQQAGWIGIIEQALQ
jgi:tetratricopeptide (TPR) repeat protein